MKAIRITDEHHEALEKKAKAEHRSVQGQLTHILDEALQVFVPTTLDDFRRGPLLVISGSAQAATSLVNDHYPQWRSHWRQISSMDSARGYGMTYYVATPAARHLRNYGQIISYLEQNGCTEL